METVDVCDVERSGLGSAVAEAWDRADDALLEQRANYWLNLSFYLGYQWVWWDSQRRSVNQLAGRRNEDDRVHAKVNLIRPRIDSLKGRLTGSPLAFEARPTGVDDATLQAAATSERVLQARHTDDGWEELRAETVFSLLMGATQLVLPDWDPRCEDVRVETFNVAEFTLEPGTRRPRDARWMDLARALPCHQAKDFYNLSYTPPSETGQDSSPVQRKLNLSRGMSNNVDLCVVHQYFQRPVKDAKGKVTKKGRVATIIDHKVVEYEDWPYPFEHLPGYVFRANIVPQRWFGDTPLNDARPVQAMYNQIRSTMLENIKLAAINRLMIPVGSLPDDDNLTDEPGQPVHYIPDGQGGKPSWLEAPSLPRDVRYEAERLQGEMDDILYTHATSRGQAPGDRNSGLALSILAEKGDTPLGAMARDQQVGWAAIGSQVIQLYEKNVTEPRTARITSDNRVPVTIQWTGKDLAGQHDIIVPEDAVMPHSRAATQAMLVELRQTFPEQFTNLPVEDFLRLLELRGADKLREVMDDDVACAVYENVMMAQGEVMIPETWHDHTRHMVEHNRERNGVRYRLATKDAQSIFDDHIRAHEMMLREEALDTRNANEILPGLGALPNANETIGSLMPRDHVDAGMPPPQALPAGPMPPV